MINFQEVEHVVKKAEKTVEKAASKPDTIDQIISLLDVIIWPLALIVILYLFKQQIREVIERFKSAKVSAQGIEFNLDSIIDDVSKQTGMAESDALLIEGGVPISKSSGDIIPKGSGDIIPKSSGDIIPKSDKKVTPKKSHAESPYQELLELRDAINQKLKHIANQNGISTSSSSNFSLTSVLFEQNKISSDTAHKLKKIIELNNKGLNTPAITHDQVSKMKRIFNNIAF